MMSELKASPITNRNPIRPIGPIGPIARVLFCTLVLVCGASHAATHIWKGAANAPWSVSANWTGGVPTSNETGGAIVEFGTGTTSLQDLNGLVVAQIHFTGTGNTINGSVPLSISGSIQDDAGGNTLAASLPVILTQTITVNVAAGAQQALSLNGDISGNFGLTKSGGGPALLGGVNTFTGKTTVQLGSLGLQSGGTAIPGDLEIGTAGTTLDASVVLFQSNQIADTVSITVRNSGILDLASRTETVGPLTVEGIIHIRDGTLNASVGASLVGGVIDADNGTFSLGGDITAVSTATESSAITAKVELNASRVLTVNAGGFTPDLSINGVISNGIAGLAGITKTGAGTLDLATATGETYNGNLTIDRGMVRSLAQSGFITTGAVTLGNANDPPGSATFLQLDANEISPNSAVTIAASGKLNCSGFALTVGALSGSGQLDLGNSINGLSVGTLNTQTEFTGLITGLGAPLVKVGAGSLTLSGQSTYATQSFTSGGITYKGTTFVNGGTLLLNAAGVIPGDLVIGPGGGSPNSIVARLLVDQAISNSVTVTVNSDGRLDLNNFQQNLNALKLVVGNVAVSSKTLTVNSLDMTGGSIFATTGQLNINGNMNITSSAAVGAGILCKMFLQVTPQITVNPGPAKPELLITGVLASANASIGFTKTGAGTLSLSGTAANTFGGTATVDRGVLLINSTSGDVIPGALVIGNATDPVNSAAVRENGSANISAASAITVNASGSLELTNTSDGVGSIAGSGSIVLNNSTLVAGKNDQSTLFSGIISGTGSFAKDGNGILTLTGNNTYLGQTMIQDGTLLLNGSQPTAIVMADGTSSSATLGGTGSIGVTTLTAAKLKPGTDAPGTLSTNNLTLDAVSSLHLDLNSATSFDALKVTGTVALGGCALKLTVAPTFAAALGAPLVVIDNDGTDPISGTFAGLPEGGLIEVGDRAFRISYAGGSGNDVVLFAQNVVPVVTSQATAVPSPAGIGETVTFSVAATDGNQDKLIYDWSFGDATTGTGASVTHAYSVAGTYNVTVIVSDGNGGVVNSTVQILIQPAPPNPVPPILGTGADTDADGFSDAFEIAHGTSPSSAASTPFGGAKLTASSQLMIVKSAIKINFARTSSDSIKFSGTLAIPENFSVTNQTVYVLVGNVLKSFTLNNHGMAKNGGNSFKISIKARKSIVAAQISKFTVSLTKGIFAADLAGEGLTNTTVTGKSVTVPFSVYFGNTFLQQAQPMVYSAREGRSGSAK